VRVREAKKLGGDEVGFGVVKGRETRDKEVKVRAVRILDAKVVNDWTKSIGRDTCLKSQGVEVS
jgi:hypothetical protein